MIAAVLGLLATLFAAMPAVAGEADVIHAEAVQVAPGEWRIDATVRHDDEGWDHYADEWEVVLPDGTVAASRELMHPHVNEQPFTRSLSGIELPEGTAFVTIRAHDYVHGNGGKEFKLTLPR